MPFIWIGAGEAAIKKVLTRRYVDDVANSLSAL